jgi:hypothetical protein
MPTKADFEAAAAKLRTAAQQVGDLTAAAEGAGAAEILQGGSLGRQVPERIAACTATALACQSAILDVESMCLERAGVIAAYEGELELYDAAYSRYRQRSVQWQQAYNSWYYSEGAIPHPGPPPSPPPRPADPPEWADVRRV